MKGRLVVLDHLLGRPAAALIEDGRLEDFLIAPEDATRPAPGAIFRAICDRPLKGQGGMMLRLPAPFGSAFLRQGKGLAPGQPILVQVTGYSEPGKAVPVTAKVLFKGRHAIVTPLAPGLNISRAIHDEARRDQLLELAHEAMEGSDFGLILRSQAEHADEGDIFDDITALRAAAETVMKDAAGPTPELLLAGPDAHELAWRDWPVPDQVAREAGDFSHHGVLDDLDALVHAEVPLGAGASIWVEPTRALVAIDVNTGADTSPAAGLKANLACARALPRQLRLRGLGGQITIDFAPMPKKDRRMLETALRAAFRADRIETTLVGWTPLGHFELQRKRERLPLAETLEGAPP